MTKKITRKPNNFRICDEPHLRDYPDCFEECGYDKCVGREVDRNRKSKNVNKINA